MQNEKVDYQYFESEVLKKCYVLKICQQQERLVGQYVKFCFLLEKEGVKKVKIIYLFNDDK